MPLNIILLTLFAALLHASWNALPPAGVSWKYAALSAALHVGYNLFLVKSYQKGDLGQTYPIARGSSLILITLAAAVFAGERISAGGLLGITLVSGGIISLAFKGRRFAVPSLPYALGTGCFIAAYSVTYGIGVRLSGAPMAYTAWMCALWGILMPLVYIALRDVVKLHLRENTHCDAHLSGGRHVE